MTCGICRFYDVCVWHVVDTDFCVEMPEVIRPERNNSVLNTMP